MNNNFKEKAEWYAPKINKIELKPINVVEFEEDFTFWQSTKTIFGKQADYYDTGDSICLDFGKHITGYFKFELGQYDEYLDAPVKLKIKFGETPYEMRRDFDTYKGGLSSTWLQEDVVNIDWKGEVSLPRRYAFRYVKITIVKSPKKVMLSNFLAIACTSADLNSVEPQNGDMDKIDRISINTLAECMQNFFEDGPKRDRRLWLGDLRLQALADYYTFKNIDLVKRCLYLFAAFDNEEELLPSYVYTKPALETGNAHLVSYALLFTISLCDYFEHTKDRVVTEDLFEVAKRQIDITEKMLDKNGIPVMPENYGWWTFIDWSDAEPVTANMGIYICAVDMFSKLCKALGKEKEAKTYEEFAKKLKKSAFEYLYDGEVFKNQYDNEQYSVQSQVWMILAGVVSKEESQRILKSCIGNSEYISPVTPYMHHYVVEALLKAELLEEAKKYIKDYWGEMAELGADTFWEVFVKSEPYCSPYGDAVMNSACHAWSCTPAYFIRKYDLAQMYPTSKVVNSACLDFLSKKE